MGPAAESRTPRDEHNDDKPADLDIDQDMRFLRRDWRVHRAGWAAMVVLIAVALAGGFGRGALADVERSEGGVTVRYDRVARHEARTSLEVHVPPSAQTTQTIWIEQSLQERWRIEQVVPEPAGVRIDGDRVLYDVNVGAEGGLVRFTLKPEQNGRARGRIGIDDVSLLVEQVVLP